MLFLTKTIWMLAPLILMRTMLQADQFAGDPISWPILDLSPRRSPLMVLLETVVPEIVPQWSRGCPSVRLDLPDERVLFLGEEIVQKKLLARSNAIQHLIV
jgi:hypothetical protein